MLCSSQGSASLSVATTSEEITVIVGEEFGLYIADNMGGSSLINFCCVATTLIKVPLTAADLVARPDEFITREISVEPHNE